MCFVSPIIDIVWTDLVLLFDYDKTFVIDVFSREKRLS